MNVFLVPTQNPMQNQVNNGKPQTNLNEENGQDEGDDEEDDDNANNLIIPNFSSAPQDNKDEVDFILLD